MNMGQLLFTQPPSAFSERLELNFLQGMLMWIFSSIPDTYVSVAESYTRKQLLFHRFMHLIHEHAAQMHQVSFYAGKLCISPRYLHEITETYSNGKTPKALIDEQLTAELKVLLNNPALSIAEIASLCQFPDSSYLSRFFQEKYRHLSQRVPHAKTALSYIIPLVISSRTAAIIPSTCAKANIRP